MARGRVLLALVLRVIDMDCMCCVWPAMWDVQRNIGRADTNVLCTLLASTAGQSTFHANNMDL